MRRLLRIGLPGGADMLAIVCCHLAYVSIINRLGDEATAAHGIGVRIESLTYLPGFAFQVAAATMVGQYLGARDPRRARRAVFDALWVGGGVMIAAGLFMYLAPEAITRFFVRDDQARVIELTTRLLPIVATAIPALAVVSILAGALRRAGDTRLPLVFTFVGLVLVRLPLAAYLAPCDVDIARLGCDDRRTGSGRGRHVVRDGDGRDAAVPVLRRQVFSGRLVASRDLTRCPRGELAVRWMPMEFRT